MTPAPSRSEGQDHIRALVERFKDQLSYYKSPQYDEASVRAHFIDPLLDALGWDVTDTAGLGPSREVVVENRVQAGHSVAGQDDWDEDLTAVELAERNPRACRPDYTIRSGTTTFYVTEAKKPSVDLEAKAPSFQVKSYAWNLGTPIGVLTNFDRIRIFDAILRPDYSRPHDGVLIEMGFLDYVQRWDELWDTLSREAVISGALTRLNLATRRRTSGASRIDKAFLAELENWREVLAQDLAAHNHGLDRWQLAEATQRILDRLIFVRVCEDRQIEPTVILRRYARTVDSYQKACQEFTRLNAVYNGVLFRPHWSEQLSVSDQVFQRLISSLYFPAPYQFDVVSVDVLGSVYERFLGKEFEVDQSGTVSLVPKPETRHAGGVYYTPRWIVECIVEQTIAPLLEEKTPRGAANIRIVDPACGSGAFLFGAFEFLIHWHEAYFTAHPNETPDRHYKGTDGIQHLTSDAKADILAKCIYGVDIDPQAVEVTQMNLYLKVLEGENRASLTSQHRLFQAAYLPPLDRNIRCGNSLLGTSDLDRQILFDHDLVRRINPFNWEDPVSGFGKVFHDRGGFDAVIGNPPYTRVQVLRRYRPEETTAYATKYASARVGSFDIAAPFVERGMSVVRTRGEPGRLGFIVSRQFCEADFGEPLRALLSSGNHIEEIVDFRAGMVFEEASAYTLIVVASGTSRPSWTLTRVPTPPSKQALAAARCSATLTASRPATALSANEWDLLLPAEELFLDRLGAGYRDLGTVARNNVFQGVVTGADFVFRLTDHGLDPSDSSRHLVSRREGNGPPVPVENALLRPVLVGRTDIRRFSVGTAREVLLLPYDRPDQAARYSLIPPRDLRRRFPAAHDWLSANRTELEARESGDWDATNWYGYSRRQNLEAFEKPKVLVPYMVEVLCAHWDTGGHWFVNVATGGYGLPGSELFNPEFMAALLSSRLLSWVLARRSRAWRGDWYAARKRNLVRLPIAEPSSSTQDDIVRLFQDCSEASANVGAAVTDQDRELAMRILKAAIDTFDQSVEELYGVTTIERELLSS